MDTGVLHEAFVLAMHGTSVAKARHRTVEWLLRHSVSQDAADTVELITSELVTNALVHSVSDVISCGLQLDDGRLRIEVTDQGAYEVEPTIRQPCLEDVSGRGLLLVEMLSEEWGVIPVLPCGRTVWAVVRTHP
ncbi:ATP-binding protein [Nonomuraea sp. NPDC050404]|uniref:ATP-binding protein n=1 Tax=Nonomuraea sp. NPDC050404 TaxID=3155783 RepID=UPI0033F9922D